MKPPAYDFEKLDDKRIMVKEYGISDDDNIVSQETYQLFVDEKRSTHGTEISIIPTAYYELLSKTSNIENTPFDDEEWTTRCAPRLKPETEQALFPFQRKAIYQMVKVKRCLNASSMGIGKTIQSLCALSILHNTHKGDLIICSGYLRDNWKRECELWLPDRLSQAVRVISKAGKNEIDQATHTLLYDQRLIKIISYDMAANIFSSMKPTARNRTYFNTVICDESHYVKEVKTKRYKMLSGIIQSASNVFLLTGTPAPNRPKELFSQFNLIRPETFSRFRTFATRYCAGYMDRFNHFVDVGCSNTAELSFLMKKIVIRLRREDVLDELPSVQRVKVLISTHKKNQRFGKLMATFNEELSNIDSDEGAKFRVQALASEMFRETASLKVDPVKEYLSAVVEENSDKLILFCVHQTMFKALQELLESAGETHIAISGQTPVKDRPGLLSQFLKDEECKYAILTIGSCSTGLNLCPVAHMIFCELTWSPSDLSQCEARISRIGGAKHLEFTYLVCKDTLDEMVFRKLAKKTQLTNDIVDDGKNYGDFVFNSNKRKTRGDDDGEEEDPSRKQPKI